MAEGSESWQTTPMTICLGSARTWTVVRRLGSTPSCGSTMVRSGTASALAQASSSSTPSRWNSPSRGPARSTGTVGSWPFAEWGARAARRTAIVARFTRDQDGGGSGSPGVPWRIVSRWPGDAPVHKPLDHFEQRAPHPATSLGTALFPGGGVENRRGLMAAAVSLSLGVPKPEDSFPDRSIPGLPGGNPGFWESSRPVRGPGEFRPRWRPGAEGRPGPGVRGRRRRSDCPRRAARSLPALRRGVPAGRPSWGR